MSAKKVATHSKFVSVGDGVLLNFLLRTMPGTAPPRNKLTAVLKARGSRGRKSRTHFCSSMQAHAEG